VTLHLEAQVAERGFDVSLDVADGETLAVLGPNGAGKSTLLAILAGLLRPDTGRAELDGESLFDLSCGYWPPPHRRGISLLAQEPLLFPHLSALENVSFGPRSVGRTRAEARASARQWLAAVEAAELGDSRPGQLSGGQAQRVAIARALAPEPRLLLLDEPLAALDVAVAPTLRRMLRTVLASRSAIVVTHEVLDALTLADRVVLLTGVRTATGLQMADGAEVTGSGTGAVGVPAAAAARPSAISVQLEKTVGPNAFPVIVQDLEPRGDSVRVRSASMVADISPGRVAALGLTPGLPVWFTVPVTEVTIYPR
jgi:molybdate transport system ATP-binding protein